MIGESALKQFFGSSFRRQLITSFALVHAMLMTVFVVVLVLREQRFLIHESTQHAYRVAQSIADSGSAAMHAKDIAALEALIQAKEKSPIIRSVLLHDMKGEILGATDRHLVGTSTELSVYQHLHGEPGQNVLILDGSHLVEVAAPMQIGQVQVGWARVTQVREAVGVLSIRDGTLYVLAALAIGVGLATLIGLRLGQDFKSLLKVADQVRIGPMDKRVDIEIGSEVGQLGERINEMLDSLQSARSVIETSEQRFRELYDNAVIPILSVDFSRVYNSLKRLQADGAEDLPAYLTEHLKTPEDLAALVSISHVNNATLVLFEADNEAHFCSEVERIIPTDSIAGLISAICKFWEGHGVFKQEVKFKTFKDQPLIVLVTFQITGVFTKAQGVPVTMIDVTDQKTLENQLRQAQKMESMGQLTGGIAHDFNNLLAIIIGNAELVKIETEGDEELQLRLNEIEKAVSRASSLTQRLLSFSRQQNLSEQSIHINNLLEGIEDLLMRTLGETIDLKFTLGAIDSYTLIDQNQFENALINLCINARDAMPEGGTLRIETCHLMLDKQLDDDQDTVAAGEYVVIAVIDTGIGITREVMRQVFEPFFTTKDVGKGSGLGLSMVYGFVKQSGGYITMKSEPGYGTCVRIYIPISREMMPKQPIADVKTEFGQGSAKILVVEDDKNVRALPVYLLRQTGYVVVEAENSDEAIRMMREQGPFDLLFADVVLPGEMNGIEIAEEARRINPDIRILFSTGYAENTVVEQGRLVAGVNLLKKPYRRDELLSTVRAAIQTN